MENRLFWTEGVLRARRAVRRTLDHSPCVLCERRLPAARSAFFTRPRFMVGEVQSGAVTLVTRAICSDQFGLGFRNTLAEDTWSIGSRFGHLAKCRSVVQSGSVEDAGRRPLVRSSQRSLGLPTSAGEFRALGNFRGEACERTTTNLAGEPDPKNRLVGQMQKFPALTMPRCSTGEACCH